MFVLICSYFIGLAWAFIGISRAFGTLKRIWNIFVLTLLEIIEGVPGIGILESMLLFGFGMEGIFLVSKPGLSLLCKILGPKSFVLRSFFHWKLGLKA